MPGGVVADAAGLIIRAVRRDADGSGEFTEPAVEENLSKSSNARGIFTKMSSGEDVRKRISLLHVRTRVLNGEKMGLATKLMGSS